MIGRGGLGGATCANGVSPSTTWEQWMGCTPKPLDANPPSVLDAGSYLTSWWCNATGLCSDATMKASQGLATPEVVYPPMPQPPAVGAPANLTLPPASGADAQATVGDVLAAQMQKWQAQTQGYFNEVAGPDPASSTNWFIWIALGLGGLLVLDMVRGR